MRSKKTGSDLELLVMSQLSRLIRSLPSDARERVVNWVAAQTWHEATEAKPTVQPASAALS